MDELTNILNWRQPEELISLSGQPDETQLVQLRDAGVTHVINLGPHDNKGALADEPSSVAKLGMEYIYIPVDFDAPTDSDFEVFTDVLDNLTNHRVHIHCIYNARVTAFYYRYSKNKPQYDEAAALSIMETIWRPGGVWADFIGKPEDANLPNRYAGYEY